MKRPLEVLVVDDNGHYCETEFWTSKFEDGTTFDLAVNPHRAFSYVQKKEYGLIVLDYHMPQMDGLEIALRLREINSCLRMIGASTSWDMEKANKAGLDAYFSGIGQVEQYIKKMIEERDRAS